MISEIVLTYTQLKVITAELEDRMAKLPKNWNKDSHVVYIGEPQLTLLPVRYQLLFPARGYETKLMNRQGEFIHTFTSG